MCDSSPTQVWHRETTGTRIAVGCAEHGISGGAEIDGRGVISIQFIATPTGWKISSMAWDDERPGLTLPEWYR